MASLVDSISLRTGIGKNCSIVILLMTSDFIDVYFEVYSGLLFKNSCTFQPYDFARLVAKLQKCKATWVSTFWCLPFFVFFGSDGKTLWLFHKSRKSLFSNFRVKCFLIVYFVYRNICVLNDVMESLIAIAPWWQYAWLNCVSGLWRPERILNFLRCILVIDLVLKDGSGIKKRNRLQPLFYFVALMGVVALVFKISFFMLCFRF